LPLAKAIAAATQPATGANAIFILNQGLLTFGATARACYERTIELVALAEQYAQAHQITGIESATAEPSDKPIRLELAQLRRALSDAAGHAMIVHADRSESALAFCRRADPATLGPAAASHVAATRVTPLIGRDISANANPAGSTSDAAPRIILDPELGVCAAGRTAGDALHAAELYRHTIAIIEHAAALGGYRAMPLAEGVAAEQAQAQRNLALFSGEVALVTGAASGIGKGCVEALLARGAAVVGLDISPKIVGLIDTPAYLGLTCDLTDEQAVMRAFEATVRHFGGLDMLVLNAGIFPPGCKIESLSLAEWQRVMHINLDSNLTVLREAYPLLKLAPRYGRVVVNGSRNVPAPGPGAGAYSASKAAVTQLARVAALEWAKDRIRINMVHPHAVFDTGIWTEDVLKARSASYGMTIEQYKTNNLLRVELTSRDVGEMVAEMCGPLFAKTTGAQVPMDGGSDRVL
jgi:NAD(P)-dependent dehydrogenase (short-subunit alcohol dehydrogenase family)